MTLTELNAWIDANVFTTNNRMNTGPSFRQVLKKVTDETFGKVETMIGATALKTPGTNWGTGKGLEIWGTGGTALGLASNYLEASIKTKIGGSAEMEFWNTQLETSFTFRDGAARTERFQLKSGHAWLPNNLHVGVGADRTQRNLALYVAGTASVTNMLGIGTLAPSARVHIASATSAALRMQRGTADFGFELGSSDIGLYNYTNSDYAFFVRANNNFIIGGSGDNGLGRLQVNGNMWGKSIITIESDSNNSSSAKIVLNQATSNAWTIENVWPGHLHFFRGTTNHVSILNDGNLDIKTGVLMPRLTTTQRDALSASNGMIIYNTTANVFQGRANGAWVNL